MIKVQNKDKDKKNIEKNQKLKKGINNIIKEINFYLNDTKQNHYHMNVFQSLEGE